MTSSQHPNRPGDSAREARIKAALKANIARRKAQMKARAASEGEQPPDAMEAPRDAGQKDG